MIFVYNKKEPEVKVKFRIYEYAAYIGSRAKRLRPLLVAYF